MKNKYNIQIIVPVLYKKYDLFIPTNKTVGEIIILLEKGLKELTKESFVLDKNLKLYDTLDGTEYELGEFIYKTSIKNGSILMLC